MSDVIDVHQGLARLEGASQLDERRRCTSAGGWGASTKFLPGDDEVAA